MDRQTLTLWPVERYKGDGQHDIIKFQDKDQQEYLYSAQVARSVAGTYINCTEIGRLIGGLHADGHYEPVKPMKVVLTATVDTIELPQEQPGKNSIVNWIKRPRIGVYDLDQPCPQ